MDQRPGIAARHSECDQEGGNHKAPRNSGYRGCFESRKEIGEGYGQPHQQGPLPSTTRAQAPQRESDEHDETGYYAGVVRSRSEAKQEDRGGY